MILLPPRKEKVRLLFFFRKKASLIVKVTESLVRRAIKSGYDAIVITLDVPLWGKRRVTMTKKFAMPRHTTLGNVPRDDVWRNLEEG